MFDLVKNLCRDDRGATATEYALLIVFVAVGIAAGANILGTNISNLFNAIGTELSKLNPALPPLPCAPVSQASRSEVQRHRSHHFPKEYNMRSLIIRFRRDERGATATEYALLIVFIALAIAVGANILGQNISTLFSNIGTEISNIKLPALP